LLDVAVLYTGRGGIFWERLDTLEPKVAFQIIHRKGETWALKTKKDGAGKSRERAGKPTGISAIFLGKAL